MSTPAEIVLTAFRDAGVSARKLARHLKVAPSTPSRWCAPRPSGCGGLIPSRYHRDLLSLAETYGAQVTAATLIEGCADA